VSASTTAESDRENNDEVTLGSDHSGSEDESNSQASSRRSRRSPRKSASSAQQLADIKQKHQQQMVVKTAKERKLEKENDELAAKLKALEEEKAATEKRLASSITVREELVGKYHSALATVGGRKSSSLAKNAGMVMQIKKVTKKKLWRMVKFIGNDAQLMKAARMVLDLLNLKDYLHKEGETDDRKKDIDVRVAEWLALYSTDVRAAINENRSYVQSEMKKIALGWLKQGKTLLPFEDFKKIALRDLADRDGNYDETLEEQFDLYLVMVSACAGSATYGDKQRRSDPVSTASFGNKLAVPPSTEAMVLVMYENCHQKWLNMHQRKEIDKIPGDIPKYSSRRHEETKEWMGKYSDSCSGNSPYGGWGADGIKQFNELKKEIATLREEPPAGFLEIETDAMHRFSAAYQAERNRKKRANGKADEDESAPAKKQKPDDALVLADFDEE
jgi:hypothetical protein